MAKEIEESEDAEEVSQEWSDSVPEKYIDDRESMTLTRICNVVGEIYSYWLITAKDGSKVIMEWNCSRGLRRWRRATTAECGKDSVDGD
jgi:hypothetical protein